MKRYKDTLVSKSSALAAALERSALEEARKIYNETTERFKATYPEDDWKWFMRESKGE